MSDNPQSIFRKESLERLSSPEQLDQLMQVVNAKSWISLVTLGSLVFMVLLWSILGRIPIVVVGRGILVHPSTYSSELVALTYFGPEMGERIRPGMQVMIVPNHLDRGTITSLLGRVETVSLSTVKTLDDARQSSNVLSQQDAIAVLARLERDSSTRSGYRWSSAAGSQVELSPGMTTTARVKLAQKAPIAFAFPFLGAFE